LPQKTAFQHYKNNSTPFNYSAKKYEKLYLFMGPANKNTTTHTGSRYYRAIGGDEKVHKGAQNVRCGIIEAVSIISIASTKKPIFS